jgi:hypothetical protein
VAREVAVARLRSFDLKKAPSISETLDWVRALAILGADHLTEELLDATLNLVRGRRRAGTGAAGRAVCRGRRRGGPALKPRGRGGSTPGEGGGL